MKINTNDNAREIANLISGKLTVHRRESDSRNYVLLNDVVTSSIKAAFGLGLRGGDAEQMAHQIQDSLIDKLAADGIGIYDDGQMWIPK